MAYKIPLFNLNFDVREAQAAGTSPRSDREYYSFANRCGKVAFSDAKRTNR